MSLPAPDSSPTPRKRPSTQFSIHEDEQHQQHQPLPALGNVGIKRDNAAVQNEMQVPLTTSKLGNQQPQTGNRRASVKKQKVNSVSSASHDSPDQSPMGQLLAKLSEQQAVLEKQKHALTTPDSDISLKLPSKDYADSSTGSSSITPASEVYVTTPKTDDGLGEVPDAAEMFRLKKELEAAKHKIARMDQELSQTRITKHTLDQAMGPPSETDFQARGDVTEDTISKLQTAFNASTRPPIFSRHDSWPMQPDDSRSDNGDALSTRGYRDAQGIWGNNAARPGFTYNVTAPVDPWVGRSSAHGMRPPNFLPSQQAQRHAPLRIDTFGGGGILLHEPTPFPHDQGPRRYNGPPSRPGSAFGPRYGGWGHPASASSDAIGISPPPTPLSFTSMQPTMQVSYPTRPVGSRLSPTAAEFGGDAFSLPPNPWNAQPEPADTYINPTEPLNYRRLLDRNVSCNWKYIVDKIVCNNDQQASIFLQQKLKVGTTEQKFDIVQAIIDQAYPLMINRFGNFLVQRCFEHGTPEQVVAIARAIRGNTLNLSMDAFGCHVVQKAFDAVPEEYKAIMVHELLRRIPETVIHRYACHVWQKLFELRWSDSPPQIMKYVNEALRGMWHEVALGETGSLVVQNIFENCLEEDKRPCINEVLASIDVVSHGQFGNWCIQHICEHGAPQDRNRAIDHVLHFASEYSTDQFASKVMEKCLKIGGPEFLDRYLDRVCEARADRPRMPLIDIAGDQFGNYLIQYILTHSNPHHREVVATHIRKHMVSLRGSKYGSRVAMLCCNPASATRPGPPTGMQLSRPNSAYGAGRDYGVNRGGYTSSYR
ncbi:putative meiotic coiled-coil protein 2 [Cryomyces antarcticus]